MTTAPMQPMFLLIELFTVIQLVRFWLVLLSRGYFGICIRTFTIAFLVDFAALALFASQIVLGVKWLAGEPSTVLTFVVFGAFFALIAMNCLGRLEHDSATRTIVALNALGNPASRIHL